MKLAVQFGAGYIGRGFIGAVLAKSGYQVVFADVVKDLVDRINADRQYTVHIKDVDSEDILISGVSAVDSSTDAVVEKIKEAELITTAVGLRIIQFIAPAIAKGIVAVSYTKLTLTTTREVNITVVAVSSNKKK